MLGPRKPVQKSVASQLDYRKFAKMNVKKNHTEVWKSVFTLIRTDTTLDLSQKAEKV